MWNFTLTPEMRRGRRSITVLVLLITILTACTGTSQPQAPTNTPLRPVTNTTVPSDTPAPTDTPVPSDTHTLLPTDTPTLEPTATQDRTATAAVEATQAVEKAMVGIAEELDRVGIQTKEGRLGWIGGEAVTLSVNTYGELDYQHIDPDLVVQDFVFQTDVTWESTGGLAACGFLFRAEDDLERGAQYTFYAIRLSGLPAWFVYRAVLAQGSKITFYANGDRLGSNLNDQLTEGRFALLARQESGETTCIFSNTWVWAIK